MKGKPAAKSRDAIRTCIGTGEKLPKNEMVRFVRNSDGVVVIDPGGKLSGRGANLCMEEEAFDLAVKRHA
ncbi:MAG: YlxR family protein, partial [Candidatus Dojkabacteria bacterium]